MAITLPNAITDYFETDRKGDAAAVANCFTTDAIVRDEGHAHTGRGAIEGWKARSAAQYSYTVEPFAIASEGGRTVVTSHVAGDFPGSPVDLRYVFTVTGEALSGLEIRS